jgi:hypothetical protein
MKLSTFAGAALLALPATHVAPAHPPSAVQFAKIFVASANTYATAHHDASRLRGAHCVEASRAHYMCAYTAVTQAHGAQCHLMQARWTPTATSTITVTLSGRTRRCGSVREAIRSLP